jgi:hypothetical protein
MRRILTTVLVIAVGALSVGLATSCSPATNTGSCDGGLLLDGGCPDPGGGTGTDGGATAQLHGQFDLTWSAYGQTFTIAGRNVNLSRHDDGPDETNYDATGNATISPTTFPYGTLTCSLAPGDVTQAFSDSYFFKLRKQPSYGQRWSFLAQWNFQCTGSAVPVPVIVNFMTGTGTVCSTPVDVPASSPTALNGSFDMNCSPWTSHATWDFHP